MTRLFGLLFCFFIILAVESANAASPFCILRNNTYRECIYDNVINCQRAADPDTNTYCIVSDTAVLTYSGFAKYCVVDANLIALCNYNDRGQCNGVARSSRGLCVERDLSADNINPYKYDDRLQR